MVNLMIDDIPVSVEEGCTILEAAKTIGIEIPSLCYSRGLNEIGACRVCIVEVEGIDKLVPSCNTAVVKDMVVYTNTPRVREARRTNIELILSQHNSNCTACSRSGNCKLQTLAGNQYFEENSYVKEIPESKWSTTFPLVRDESKCIKCMRCIQICDKVQGLNVWDVENTGARTSIAVSGLRDIEETDCSLCGQCITHCPTGALHVRNDSNKNFSAKGALSQSDKIKVVQIAPAVRTAWGEGLGLSGEFATAKRLAGVLKRIGFDYVFDTNFSADLTIMEESAEVLNRLLSGKKHRYPLFTSCCPGWVRFLKSQYPDMVNCLSTSKSPQQMFGAIAKSYFADKIGVSPERIYCVSVMPCVAKKAESELPSINDSDARKDIDLVLTTRELVSLIKRESLDVSKIEESEFDSPLGYGSGAGVIFGTTGGVMEAALRTAYYKMTGNNPGADAFSQIRSGKPWREATFEVTGTTLHIAVVSGLSNTRKLIRALRKGEVVYDFVEVMACPGGCVGGGGQPIHDGIEMADQRAPILYELDENSDIRFSHENPDIITLYNEYLGEPLSEKAHKLLHTNHEDWDMPLSPKLDKDVHR